MFVMLLAPSINAWNWFELISNLICDFWIFSAQLTTTGHHLIYLHSAAVVWMCRVGKCSAAASVDKTNKQREHYVLILVVQCARLEIQSNDSSLAGCFQFDSMLLLTFQITLLFLFCIQRELHLTKTKPLWSVLSSIMGATLVQSWNLLLTLATAC